MDKAQHIRQPRQSPQVPDHKRSIPTPENEKKLDRRVYSIMLVTGVILFAGPLSPQIDYLGRGLLLILPTFAVFFVFVLSAFKPNEVGQGILHSRYGLSISCGVLFIIMGFIRNEASPNPTFFQNHIINSVLNIMYFVAIIFVKRAMPRVLDPIRMLTLLIAGVSLAISIPILASETGIMRSFQGISFSGEDSAMISRYALQGVGNYPLYYAFAIGAPTIANWLYRQPRRPLTVIGWGALILTSIAVILSTLTLAVVVLVVGMLIWTLLILIKFKRLSIVFITIAVIFVSLPFLQSILVSTQRIEAITFVIDKLSTSVEGVSERGIVEGDETGRGLRLEESLKSFLSSPFMGNWGLVEDYYSGGHSSWVDSLVLYGIFGTSLYIIFLLPAWIRRKPFSITDGAAGGTISWVLCLAIGVLNPTFYFRTILTLIWLYDDVYP